jgi:anti-sigma regulatory factor (Ser/Thr protein kinase)
MQAPDESGSRAPSTMFFPFAATFPAEPNVIRHVRRLIADQLPNLDEPVAESVTLMLSELATNSVQYANTEFTVTIERLPRRIRVGVFDAGPGNPQMRAPTPREASGRGLRIVERLSDEWGVQVERNRGKTVWFTITV